MPKKYALIIGINTYLYMEDQYQLRGCVNDAKLMKNVLINKFNFDPANITSLHNESATRDAIIGEMDRLAQRIQKDDILVFHYSGHGHQCKVKEDFSAEGSGKDNCILPTDDSEPDGENVIWREIRDKEFNAWLQRIAEKTRYTTLIFDACHSGTMTRDVADTARSRSIPTEVRDLDKRSPASPSIAALTHSSSSSRSEKIGAGGWLTLSENYTVISGCRDTQTSKEWEFTIDGEGVRHGVMTYFLTRALLHAKPGNTYRDAFEQVCSGVVAEVADQNPQIEGAIDRELFGVADIEPFAHIRITKVQGNSVTLDGGIAHGIHVGAKWDIYPSQSKTANPQERLGSLKIEEVGGLSSQGQLLESSGKVVPGARCIEVEPVAAAQLLSVDLSQVAISDKAELQSLIEQSSVLKLVQHSGQVLAKIVDKRSGLPQGLITKQQAGFPAWVFLEQQDQLCMPLHGVTEPNVTQVLFNNLEKIAKFKRVMQLNNVKSDLDVAFNVYKQLSDGSLVLANGGTTQFEPSESMVLEIKNNDTTKTLFFTILWISANKEIAHFYPPRKTCELINPQTAVHIGKGRNLLSVALSSDFPSDMGIETCKIIFSTKEADFSWLHQQGVRTGDDLQDEDWFAINRSFILKRPMI